MESARGYVALTDPDWYRYLASRPKLDEVNFWQPHSSQAFRALKPGDPFFFKLRAPYRAIAGFGFYQRFERLPAHVAWELFGETNGAPDEKSMVKSILSHRRDLTRGSNDFSIGCIMIAAPVFFERDEWVSPPSDWAPSGIQKGKTYDVLRGEGQRLLAECMERATGGLHYWNVEKSSEAVGGNLARYGEAREVRPRLGQGLFSFAVRDAYGGACAVTGEHSLPVLEAAHIVPYVVGGEHRVDNGLLLRSDLHRLYDRGYVTVTPDYVFRVGDSLMEEFHNGRSYYAMRGTRVSVPQSSFLRPSQESLDWHVANVFRG